MRSDCSCRRVRAGLLSGFGPLRFGGCPSLEAERFRSIAKPVSGEHVHMKFPKCSFALPKGCSASWWSSSQDVSIDSILHVELGKLIAIE
ncbi:hypothetical protein KC352_g34 [Hortaea werneckii]|nr:hypothetical protein KC352_g34 [Hortaea werneckii]